MNEVVTLEGAYTDAYQKRGQGYVVLEAGVKGEDGREIVNYRGVEIFQTTPGNIAGRASASPVKKVSADVPEGARFIVKAQKDVKAGDALEPLHKNITAEQAAVFSEWGNLSLISIIIWRRQRKGKLRIPIVQGAQFFCTLTELLTRTFGADFFTDGWLRAKFIAPVKVFEPFETAALLRMWCRLKTEEEKWSWRYG